MQSMVSEERGEKPGIRRAKLRLSRGFPRDLAYHITPANRSSEAAAIIRIKRKVQEDRTDAVARRSGIGHDPFGYFSFRLD
jgi:hypothetical protein